VLAPTASLHRSKRAKSADIRKPNQYNQLLVMTMDRERFESLVWQAMESLPATLKKYLKNVLVVIEEVPSPALQAEFGDDMVFGLYQGTPLTERSVWNVEPQPDIVYIFQKNIESVCESEDEIYDEIRTTVIHEIGHYFGLNEEQLDVLEKDQDETEARQA
jgi:predicted Zn-dependent protease with MMP-like domain